MPRHLFEAITTRTTTYNVALGDNLVLCNGTFTVTLPDMTSPTAGRTYTIKNIGSGVVTVDGYSTETIDGKTTQTLNQWDSMTVTSDGSNWYIV